MIEIPANNKDDSKSRMERFVEYVVNKLKCSDSVEIADDSQFNDKGIPGISCAEARELARLFGGKGYHAKAYYIDYPSHGFRHVTIAKYVMQGSEHRCSHSEVWA